jgi:hypothetical protein
MTKVGSDKISRHGKYDKQWTFITNHAAVLSLLTQYPRITAKDISQEAGITERSVWMIIRDLDKGGYISRIREGRGVRYIVDFERPMRHKTQRDVAVSRLLSILTEKDSSMKIDPTA